MSRNEEIITISSLVDVVDLYKMIGKFAHQDTLKKMRKNG
jgi:hypothetical protein